MQNVFVIDNDLERRDFFYDILTQLDCQVTTLPSLGELQDALKKERPGCVIMDVDSNGHRAKEALQKIREIDRKIRIIALVSQDMEKETEDTGGNGITYLKKDMKPVDMVPHLLKVLRDQDAEPQGAKVTFSEEVLIIDDDQETAFLLKNYLSERGYKVDTAFNGEEALIMIRAQRPKVIILDIMMPGMDGLLVLKHIKEIDTAIEVIVTSGLSEQKVIEDTLKLGASLYLNKPFGLDKLEAAILTSMVKPMF